MFTAMIPASVSRTPQRLMFTALGEACSDITTRTTAAAITNTPGKRSRLRVNFLLRLTPRFQSMGIGVTRIKISVMMLAGAVAYSICGLNWSQVSMLHQLIRILDTHSALESRIRYDLPILLNRETAATDSQEDRNVGEHDNDGQPSHVGLHA